MSVIGIVCEFDPFHYGHKYLIDAVRGDGDTVVCVMSGNFTQRAEPALFDKRYRVCAALKNGVDIVLELPFIYATATAEIFAGNAVDILLSFGCDKIAFGIEEGDRDVIRKAAEVLSSDGFSQQVDKQLKNDISYPVARETAFKQYGVDFDISKPNNILAVEYTKQILQRKPKTEIIPVIRKSVSHNETQAFGEFASASLIRDMFAKNQDIYDYIPKNAAELYDECRQNGDYVLSEKYSVGLQAMLRSRCDSDDSDIAYMTDELANRINSAIRDSYSLDSLFDNAKTKRYTHSRVRRAVLCKAFGITKKDLEIGAPYIMLLGFNKNADKILGEKSKSSTLPVVSGYKQVMELDDANAKRVCELQLKSTDLYNLVLKTPKACSDEIRRQIIKI